jgi:hypothetical protein
VRKRFLFFHRGEHYEIAKHEPGTDSALGLADRLANGLTPPGVGPDLRWRLAVTFSIGGIVLWIVWAMNGLAWFVPGLARADEVEKLSQQVGEVRAALIADKIDAISTQLCMERFDAQLIAYRRELQEQYHGVKRRYHESPPCEVLLKLSR